MQQTPKLPTQPCPIIDCNRNTLVAMRLQQCSGALLWRLYVAIERDGVYQFKSSNELFAPDAVITDVQARECMEQGNNIGNGQTEMQIFPHLFKQTRYVQ